MTTNIGCLNKRILELIFKLRIICSKLFVLIFDTHYFVKKHLQLVLSLSDFLRELAVSHILSNSQNFILEVSLFIKVLLNLLVAFCQEFEDFFHFRKLTGMKILDVSFHLGQLFYLIVSIALDTLYVLYLDQNLVLNCVVVTFWVLRVIFHLGESVGHEIHLS